MAQDQNTSDTSDTPGFGRKVATGARRVGAFYVWTLAGDWREVRENAGRLRERLRALRNRRYRKEAFEDAVERLDLNDDALRVRRQQLGGLSFLYALIVVVALVFLCLAPLSDHPINHALLSVGVGMVSGSKYLAARFRIAQIDAGELFGFMDWLFGKAAR